MGVRSTSAAARTVALAVLAIVSVGGPVLAQAPTATTGAAVGVGDTQATLNGTVNANGLTTTVTFEYGTSMAYDLTTAAAPDMVTGSTDTAVTASIFGLAPNETYYYRVVAQNMAGTTYGAGMSLDTLPVELISFTVE